MVVVRLNPDGEQLRRNGGLMSGEVVPCHLPAYTGTLSIKSVVRGAARWRTADGEFLVEPGQVLILNHGQRYSLTIEGDQQVQTLCPFFAPALVREAARARSVGAARALDDDPDDVPGRLPEFVERLRRPSVSMHTGLHQLARAVRAPTYEGESNDRLLSLLDVVFEAVSEDRRLVAALSAKRAATREELFVRVCRARDYVHANLERPLSLGAMAKVAGMSSYHFHRCFLAVFATTPARYVSERRLERAHRLLAAGQADVTQACAGGA